MEETRNEASGENKLFEDRETRSIDPSDHASSSSLFISPAAPVLLQQPHYIRASPTINWSCSETETRRDGNLTATISAERSGHFSEATARSFPLDPQTIESTMEPSERASSSLPVLWPDPSLAPPYVSMMPSLPNVTYVEEIDGDGRVSNHNPHMPPDQFPYTTPATESASFNQAVEVIPPFSEGQTSTLTSATNSAISDEATVTNTTPAKKRKQLCRKPRTKFTPEQLDILQRELKLNTALSKQRKKEIARKTNLPEETVQKWFNNNRHKMNVKMNENARNPCNKQEVFDESSQQASSSSSVLPSTSHEHDTEVSPQAEIVIKYTAPASGSCSNTDDVSNIVRFQQENSHASN
ncbi:unnamed protein product [Clavelina lepadiformis]|uniref:Homeobox domain-containing protein n=1 Tax=Clavelina lepadiformis TaxID=159417 RepID=A0ABP0FR47_CLALP